MPGVVASALDHLLDATTGQSGGSVRRDGPYGHERRGTSMTIEIHINKAQGSGLGAPRAGINHEPDDRRVTTLGEPDQPGSPRRKRASDWSRRVDAEVLDRRMAACDAHVALGDRLVESGNMLFGVAILNDRGQMAGSMLVVDFESREALDEWLAIEPYVTGNVWQSVEVEECRVGRSFTRLTTRH
jgi:hypothetical protein